MASYNYSPYSSAGNDDSAGGTPDTRLTAFSPDDPRVPRAVLTGMSPSTLLKEGHHDPFVTASSSKTPGLSATASAFRPVSKSGPATAAVVPPLSSPLPGTAQYLSQVIAESTSPQNREVSEGVKFGTFTTDTGATRCIKVSGIYDKMVMPAVQATFDALHKVYQMAGTHRSDSLGNITRLRLSNINDAAAVYNAIRKDHMDLAVEYISVAEFSQAASPGGIKPSAHEGQVLFSVRYPVGEPNRLGFEETMRAMLSVEGSLCAWKRTSTPGAEIFSMIAEFADAGLAQRAVSRFSDKTNNNHALTTLMASVTLHTPDTSGRHTPEATPTRAQPGHYDFGEGFSRLNLSTPQSQVYGSHTTTDLARLSNGQMVLSNMYSPQSHQGYMPGMAPFTPTTFSPFGRGMSPFSPTGMPHGMSFERHFADMSPSFGNGGYYGAYPPHHHGGRGYSRPSPGREYSPGRDYSPRGGAMVGPHRRRGSQNPAAGQHNQVDPSRINAGIDVRTTVMLRNIPNKVNQAELKEIIDQSSFGKYDFMYLRIDFSNDCNVGYAFINFADPLDIIPFVTARSGEKWTKFRSDKVAEVSYATIQGRDCLIQKFRNSSVMLEPSHYRPKLFFTLTDTAGRAGEEEEFPVSDNASKLKRSCENAEHVGLFAPSAGQHLRDEQRRRRSQYDRGTSLAEREDFEYDEGHPGFHGSRARYLGYQ